MTRLTRRNPDGAANFADADFESVCAELTPMNREKVRAIVDKLTFYEDAEKQGRLVRLPCGIGETVYLVVDGRITEWEVEAIEIRAFYASVGLKRGRGGSLKKSYVLFSLWGEIAFSTRAEAEAALKGGVA